MPMIPLDHAGRVMLCAVLLFAAAAVALQTRMCPPQRRVSSSRLLKGGGLVAKNATIDLGQVPFNQHYAYPARGALPCWTGFAATGMRRFISYC
jgi:hypothetical protein